MALVHAVISLLVATAAVLTPMKASLYPSLGALNVRLKAFVVTFCRQEVYGRLFALTV